MSGESLDALVNFDPAVSQGTRRLMTPGFRRMSQGIIHSALTAFSPSERPASTREPEGSEQTLLHPTFMSEITHFESEEYARAYFRAHGPSKVFTRRFTELSPGVKFQADPIKTPLLLTKNRSEAKISIAAFKLILKWTGAGPASRKGQCSASTCRKLLKILKDAPEVRDEIFCQLVKQTRKCPDPGCLSNTWDLFLIVATIFPSSQDSEGFIKSHLANCAKAPNRASPTLHSSPSSDSPRAVQSVIRSSPSQMTYSTASRATRT
jgi:hypothetical protein